MSNYEKDLQYANNILRILNAFVSGEVYDYEKISIISTITPNTGYACHEYIIEDDYRDIMVAYLEETYDRNRSYINPERLIFIPNSDSYVISLPDSVKVYNCSADPITEEWYFQYSLLLTVEEMSTAVLIKTLNTANMSTFNYFSLMTNYVDDLIKILDRK